MDISSWACDVLFLYIYVIWECKRTNGFPSKYTPRFYFSDFFMYLAKVESFFWFSNIATPTSGKSARHIQRPLRPLSISLPKPAIKESARFWWPIWLTNAAARATTPSSPASPPTTSPAYGFTNAYASAKSQDSQRSAANSTAGLMSSTSNSFCSFPTRAFIPFFAPVEVLFYPHGRKI